MDVLAGRTFSEDGRAPGSRCAVAVVSDPYFKSHGGDLSLLGKTVKMNPRPFTIVGIAPRGFTGTSALVAPEVWVPIGANGLVGQRLHARRRSGLAGRPPRTSR